MALIPNVSIIDDDASVRNATKRIVRSMDLIAHTFASCVEFLTSPRVEDTACIVADVQMPVMSGLELQEFLRNKGRAIPIIFITAYPDDEIQERALAKGAICFLKKPFDGPTLVRCIERALSRNRP